MYEPTCADLCSDNLNKRWSTALSDLVVVTFACSGGDSMLGRWEFNLASPFFKVYKVRSPAYFEDRNFKGVYTPTFEVVAQKRKKPSAFKCGPLTRMIIGHFPPHFWLKHRPQFLIFNLKLKIIVFIKFLLKGKQTKKCDSVDCFFGS